MRKNVLILGHNDGPQFIDIYNQYTRLFDKNKYKVTVAYLTGEPHANVKDRLLAEEIIVFNFPKKVIRGIKLKAIYQLYKLARSRRFDLVICHRYKPAYIMLWVSKLTSIKRIIIVMHELGTMASRARQSLMTLLANKSTLIAGVSNAVRDDIRKSLTSFKPNQIITLYNMIDLDIAESTLLARENSRAQLNLTEHDVVFANLARLVPNKDHQTLLEAFALIKPRCPHAKLIIMGSGQLANAIQAQINRLGLQHEVRLSGFIPGAPNYLAGFDGFVLSSVQEAFGRVLLEAMAAKIPVIATDVHGIPEVMGTIGHVVPARDVNALASAMEEIYHLSPAERAKRGMEGYLHAQESFSIPQFQRQMWALEFMQALK